MAERTSLRADAAGGMPQPELQPGLDDRERVKAAGVIQRNYRGHRARREIEGLRLDPSTRWMEAVRDAQYQNLTNPSAPQNSGGARKRWIRVTKIAERAGADDGSDSITDESENPDVSEEEARDQQMSQEERQKRHERRMQAREARKKTAKMMDLQYFLEMVDQKHRYGSSLRKYHNYWKTQDTNDNFFHWLDYGDGKQVDLPECSRARLDKEQVRYLSREERLNYLVKIDDHGLLRWAKNGELVWTKDELYEDSVEGIVPISDPTPKYQYNVPPDGADSSSIYSDSNEEGRDDRDNIVPNEGERYVNDDYHRSKGPAKVKCVNEAVIFNHLIRTSLKKGHKWIFVADTSLRIYIGYKQSGAFQHSSFMHGARIAAAGLIKVKHGQLRSLSPLSGHYRPPAENFRSFVQSLRNEGVDMSRVSIPRSYAILVGMERYTRAMNKIQRGANMVIHQRDKLLHPEKVEKEEEAKRDMSQSAEQERQYLERLKLEEEKKSNESSSGRISKLVHRFTGKKQSEHTAETVRRISGTGPEDGIPAPEGKR